MWRQPYVIRGWHDRSLTVAFTCNKYCYT